MPNAIAAMAAFNLVCSGVIVDSNPAVDEFKAQPITLVYRIDLESRRWCKDDCSRIMSIKSVSNKRIVLNMYHSSDVIWIVRMNRQTGGFQDITKWARSAHSISMHGDCERAPFTGFP